MPRKHYPTEDESETEVDVKSDDEEDTLEAAPPKQEEEEEEENILDQIPDIVKPKRPRGRPKVVKEAKEEKPKKRLSEKQLGRACEAKRGEGGKGGGEGGGCC